MRGGFRQNAGRKKGFAAKNAEEARKRLSVRLAEEIGEIAEVLISEAKKGNIRAIKELFDRAWWKPPQAIQIDSERKNLPIPIGGLKWNEISRETLTDYAFTDEERLILEERLVKK